MYCEISSGDITGSVAHGSGGMKENRQERTFASKIQSKNFLNEKHCFPTFFRTKHLLSEKSRKFKFFNFIQICIVI
jgi:hypothetical protein